ncbi:gfo/Idh/MocA family oxidoreductase [Brevibacterium permense]|uniref:Gfo/Idh/MocA family protein n=1 Tax=Brevibacterium permense TaxID=234834 RepID=UPI0021CE0C78|nr:gfo/Idh/MocA family oxidoreductase [Brevibacterium permense]
MKQQDRIGVGLISVGWMGRLHSRAYLATQQFFPELPQHPELVIAADPDDEGRRHAEQALGYRDTTTDYHELLEHPDVDVVSICAPNFLHRQIALDTIKAGKPFWIEKPMGRSAEESREIAEAARAAGLVTAVGFNYRHAPALTEARRIIRSGELGRITNVQIRMMADYAADPSSVFTWRYENDRAGSGVLGDVLSHGFDLAQYLVGRISSVTSVTDTFVPERPLPAGTSSNSFNKGEASTEKRKVENEDYTALLARFDGGALGVFESSRVATGPHTEYTAEVYGSTGSLRWNFEKMNELQLADDPRGYRSILTDSSHGEFGRFQPNAGPAIGFNDLKTIEASLFLRSVAENKQLAPSVADGWSAAELVDATMRSADSGAWTSVPEVAGETTYDS